MSLWNDQSLTFPCEDVCAYDLENVDHTKKITSLITTLSEASVQVGRQHPIWMEIKIFQDLMKRLIIKVPSDKFLQCFKRLGRCTRNLLDTKISEMYLTFAGTLLEGLKEASQLAILPSRQQLEFILIRTQGITMLLCNTIELTNSAFVHVLRSLSIGHQRQNLVMAAASLARISMMYKALLLDLCEIYKRLFTFKDVLKVGVWQWHANPNLPTDLLMWLGPKAKAALSEDSSEGNKFSFLDSIFTSVKEEKHESEIDVITINDDDDDEPKAVPTCIDIPNNAVVDLGEVVPREKFTNGYNYDKLMKNAPEEEEEELDEKIKTSLKKLIEDAKSMKFMKKIFNRLNVLSSKNDSCWEVKSMKRVKRIFSELKRELASCRGQKNKDVRLMKKEVKELVVLAKRKLLKEVRLKKPVRESVDNKICVASKLVPKESIRPTKSFKKLQELFIKLLAIAMERKDEKLCKKLKKLYREGRCNAKLIRNAGDVVLCKKFILRTSKRILKACDVAS